MADVPLRFALLGRLRAWHGDTEVPLGPGRQRALLVALLLSAGRPVAADQIIDFVWPRGAPEAAGTVLRTYVERLAIALEPDREFTGVLRPAPGGGYLLAVEADQIDLLRFRALAAGAAGAGSTVTEGGDGTPSGGGIGGTGPAAAYGFLAEAMGYVDGPPADDLDSDIRAHPWIVAAEREVLAVVLAYAEAAAAGGHAKEAAERLAQVARWAPVDEALHAALIRTLRIAGRRDDALIAYERFHKRLHAKCGRVPGPDVEREHHTALSGSVSWVGRRPAGIPLVGRDGDLDALSRLLATRRCVTLTGPDGVGKTSLALALAQRAATAFDLVAVAELGVLPAERPAPPADTGTAGKRRSTGEFRSAAEPRTSASDSVAESTGILLGGVLARTLAFDLAPGSAAGSTVGTAVGSTVGTTDDTPAAPAAAGSSAGRPAGSEIGAPASISTPTTPIGAAPTTGVTSTPTGLTIGAVPKGEIEEALRGRRVLLVLDNADHVRSSCARLAGRLLGACPALTVLTTSRAALDLADETVWDVTPLSVATGPRPAELAAQPAVRLFLRRARESAPDTDLSGSLPLVWELCRMLGGSPLAIELAAARLCSLSPVTLRDRIAGGSGESSPTRSVGAAAPATTSVDVAAHGAVEASLDLAAGRGELDLAIRWSYELLSKAERLLLGRLAVFAGTFPVAAAEEVAAWGVIEAAAPVLRRLVTYGFLRPDGTDRYRLLPAIRDIALARADDGELAAARRRHQDRYLRLAERSVGMVMTGPAPIQAAAARAAAAAAVGEERHEILLAVERAADEDNDEVSRAMDLVTSARGLLDRLDHGVGDLHGALRRARAALSATRASSARLTMLVGLLRQETPNSTDPRVVNLHRRRLAVAVRRRDLCATLINGQEAVVSSRSEQARRDLERARDLLASGDPREWPHLAAILVDLAGLTADPDGVAGLLRAVELARAVDDPEPASAVMARAAEQLAWWGRCTEADTLLGGAPALDRHRHRVATVDLLAGRLGIARAHAQAVAEATARPLPQRARISALLCLCWTDLLAGDPEEALRRAGHALRAAERIKWTAALPELHRIRAHAHWRAGRAGPAIEALRQGIALAAELPDPQNLVRALHLAAAVTQGGGSPAAAEIARLARTCRVKSGLRPWPLSEGEYAGWERALGVAGDPVRTTAVPVDSLVLTASDRVTALLAREQD